EVLGRVAAESGGDVAGIGLTGQMHGSVFLNEGREVIRPALLWNDQRTASQCEVITERVGADRLIEITGNPALTGFQAPKVLWLRDVEPVQYRHLRHVLLPKDFVRMKLTGELASDVSDASGTLLLDVRRRDWSAQILAALDIPADWMPQVLESAEVSGRLLPAIAGELGLPADLPVAAGAGDNAAAAIGTGIVAPGRISSSIGSSGVLFAHAEQLAIDRSGRLHAFCHAVPQRYHLMAVTLAAGASLRWWRNILGGAISYDELGTLADVFNLPIQRTIADEGPAYGAALLAGVAAGVFDDVQEAAAKVRLVEGLEEPNPETARIYESVYGTFRQLYPALHAERVAH